MPLRLELLASALLFSAALPVYATTPDAGIASRDPVLTPGSCTPPVYPKESRRFAQQGVVTLGFLIARDGTVKDTRILGSSGHAPLDQSAIAALSSCRFAPASTGGELTERWLPVQYVWQLSGPSGVTVAQYVRRAAEQGSLDAKYALSRLPGEKTPVGVAERQRWLLAAAEEGHAMAQFSLGEAYARGRGVTRDRQQALAWYQKAAAQGNVLAQQRLAGFATQARPGAPVQ